MTPSAVRRVPALVPAGRHDSWPPFDLDRPVTLIGSRQRAHIRLESDEVSRSHAIVVNTGGKVVIRDLASRTHVYVNGREVQEAVLQDGDHVSIGRFALRFAAGEAPGSAAPRQAPGAAAAARLIGEGLDPAGVPLHGSLCVVGARKGVDLVLKGKDVSFAHAVIVDGGGRHLVRDLGSRTGTFVDGVAVEGDAELRPGSVIGIGSYRMRYTPVSLPGALATPEATAAAARREIEISAAGETWFAPREEPANVEKKGHSKLEPRMAKPQAAALMCPPVAPAEAPPSAITDMGREASAPVLSERDVPASAPAPEAEAFTAEAVPFDEIGAVLDAAQARHGVAAEVEEPRKAALPAEVVAPVGALADEPARHSAPVVADGVKPDAPAAQPHKWSSKSNPTPPPSAWGVLAVAVAMAEQPRDDESATPWSDVVPQAVKPRRSWRKYLIAAIVLAAVAGAGFILFKTDAYGALRKPLQSTGAAVGSHF